MKFEIYKHTGSWGEALGIFLYSKLLLTKEDQTLVKIEDFKFFELTDEVLANYNAWITAGCPKLEVLSNWLKINPQQIEDFETNFGMIYKPKVEVWSDRGKTGYFKQKLQLAFEFENYISAFFLNEYGLELGAYLTAVGQYEDGENRLGIEIKYDNLIKKYGNLYIEYAEKSRAENKDYINSGILKKDKSRYFLIGDYEKFYIFRKQRLVEIFEEEKKIQENGLVSTRGITFKIKDTSLGFVFPVKNAEAEVIRLDVLVGELKQL